MDFSSTDSLNITYRINNPDRVIGFTLNKNGLDLECENIKDGKQCIVPIYHFEGKKVDIILQCT